MKTQIIPTINVDSETKFIEQLKAVENLTDIVQIDIADGIFTAWKNWHDPEIIKEIDMPAKFELHLMVKNPEEEIKKWLDLKNINRVIIHAESDYGSGRDLSKFYKTLPVFFAYQWETGIALNPETSAEILEPIAKQINYVMLLGVNPGKSGQTFDSKVLEKIQTIRNNYPEINIEVDGGVNENNIKDAVKAGADIICLGSGIFNEQAIPKENFAKFQKIVKAAK